MRVGRGLRGGKRRSKKEPVGRGGGRVGFMGLEVTPTCVVKSE